MDSGFLMDTNISASGINISNSFMLYAHVVHAADGTQ